MRVTVAQPPAATFAFFQTNTILALSINAMLDGYHLLTLTHRQAALEDIGLAMARQHDGADPAPSLKGLRDFFGWEELYYLSTCNRVVYVFYQQGPVSDNLADIALGVLRPELTDTQRADLASAMQVLHGGEAIRHLLEVAASMDSLVVGEREILRQLREAYDRSHAWGLTGDHIRLLIRFTIETAKEIYTATGIGEKALSVVALAFQALQHAGIQTDARILLVGAGQTNALFAKFLAKYGYRQVVIFNRTLSKAEALAQTCGARALPLDALEYYTEGFDALVVCTGATEPVITPALYHRLLAAEPGVKTVVDLSVPNNADKRIAHIFPVRFIDIESLRGVARENLAFREGERQKAAALIHNKLFAFRHLWHERQVERSMAHIPGEVRQVKEKALNQVFEAEFARLDPAAQDLVVRMLDYMEKKCVAIPIKTAKAMAAQALKHMTGQAKPAKHS